MTQHRPVSRARDQRDPPPMHDPAFFAGTLYYRQPRVVLAIDAMAAQGDIEDAELLDISSQDTMGPIEFLSVKQGQLH